jgi:hypothetical protein
LTAPAAAGISDARRRDVSEDWDDAGPATDREDGDDLELELDDVEVWDDDDL